MTSMEERILDSVLSSLTNDLKPDITSHNKLRRSWVELEKHKFQQVMQLRHKKREIELRMHTSLQSLSTNASQTGTPPQDLLLPLPERSFPSRWTSGTARSSMSVPGFRYRANGETRLSVEEARKAAVVRSFRGLSRHVIDKKWPLSIKPVAMSCQTSADSVLTTDAAQGDDTPAEPCVKKHGKPIAFFDEASCLRVRKVQEQLGLSSPSSQGVVDGDRNINMHPQGHPPAFKAVHILSRSSDAEVEKDTFLNNKSCRLKKALKDTESCLSQNNSDATSTLTSSVTSLRDRCCACRHVARSEVSDLVKCSNHVLYKKPRWRHAPMGCYVPPPPCAIRSAHPALFNCSRSKNAKKDDGIKQQAQSSKTSIDADGLMLSSSQPGTPPGTATASFLQHSSLRLQVLRALQYKSDCEREGKEPVGVALGEASPSSGRGSVCDVPQASGDVQADQVTSTLHALSGDIQADRAASTLHALRKKNSQERVVVQQKMQKFLHSLGERSC